MSMCEPWLCLLFILATAVCLGAAEDPINCSEGENSYKCHLSTMTPYRFIANANDSVLEYSDCLPRKIWMLIRHGTRYPGKKWSARMINELPQLRDSILESHSRGSITLDAAVVELLKNWRLSFSDEYVMNLAEEGKRELISMAERYQSRFPSLLPEICSNDTYLFKYTATQRAEESAKHFVLGLFGQRQARGIRYPQPEHRDQILRFYKRCKLWSQQVDKNPESMKEKDKFVESSVVQEMIKEVSERLGLDLDFEKINLIHKICAFETAFDERNHSPWCDLLSTDNFKVLEFVCDLQYYWIDGYGYPLTYEQACTAMNDLFNFFTFEKEKKVVAYFTHSGTILKVLALLGVAKDEAPLQHDSFSFEGSRAWRTSLIDAFASNIVFVLYDCEAEGPSILAMHQERVLHLPGCPRDRPCPMSTMRDKYPDTESECPFEAMCTTEK